MVPDDAIRATLLRAALDLDGPATPTTGDWHRWRDLAVGERIVPLLFEVVRRGDVRDASLVDDAEALALDVAGLSVRLERALLLVADRLDGAGIGWSALKGLATAHLDHPEPSRRQFGDVDLIVAPDDLVAARATLERGGWHQAYPLPRHHERFTHAVTFGGVGIAEIDLHQRLGHRAIGLRIPTSELLASRVPFPLAGTTAWALCGPHRLVHAALHTVASRGDYRRLSSTADVLVLCHGPSGSDPAAVLADADRWRLRPLVEAAVRIAHAAADLPVPEAWLDALAQPTRSRDRLIELAYLGDRRRPLLEEVAHLRAMARWSDRALYLYGHLRMDEGPGSGGIGVRLRYLRSRLRDR